MEEEELQDLVLGEETKFLTTTTTTKLELTVDEVIEDYIGSFGFSQLLHVFLVSLAWIFDSQNTLVAIFADAQPSWTCKGGGSWCSTNSTDIGGSTGTVCGLKSGTWEWVGGKGGSTIAEWGLVCDHKFRAGIPSSLFFLGSLIGSIVYGRLADAYLGRKKTVMIACILTSITTFLTSLSPNVWVYAFLRFLNGLVRSGIGICCLVLSTETVGRKWRAQVGQYGFFFFTLGFLSLPLIAYPTKTNWRNIYMIISVLPLIYAAAILPFVSESPRWLAVKGRRKEAMEVLNKFARLNGKKLPKNLTLISPTSSLSNEKNTTKTKTLWSATWAAKRMITIMISGFVVGFVYYGIQLNVENLSFNLYYTVALNALMEIPAVFMGSVLLSFTDRRLLLSTSAYIAGASLIMCAFISVGWVQLTAEAIGFMAASTAFDVLYVYCVELFPTNVRNFSVSMLRQALMLGASLSPLLVVVGRLSSSVSFLLFGGLAMFSGFLMLLLPETRNSPLYETLEQQEEEEKLCSVSDSSSLELGKQ
ncbi:hypothetical protein GIB67_006297 [Kingdonia uniflora]|uniref:Major facilitator superfamily (MFS) profile domain-containing protein n=1 Tax=Kingdonia uniflora TaxID=39325 RepID=A0A7J7P5C0_9MAGN|nr:hypothetical protein GIB67_006297 [Kingdonia uniflora]